MKLNQGLAFEYLKEFYQNWPCIICWCKIENAEIGLIYFGRKEIAYDCDIYLYFTNMVDVLQKNFNSSFFFNVIDCVWQAGSEILECMREVEAYFSSQMKKHLPSFPYYRQTLTNGHGDWWKRGLIQEDTNKCCPGLSGGVQATDCLLYVYLQKRKWRPQCMTKSLLKFLSFLELGE